MATTKKPSAKQIAARKKFAAAARSGAFKRKAKSAAKAIKKLRAPKRKRNPVAKAAADSRTASGALKLRGAPKRKPARRRNPVDTMSRGPKHKAPAGYAVHRATAQGDAGALVAKFVGKADAVTFARDWATRNKARAVVVGKAVA